MFLVKSSLLSITMAGCIVFAVLDTARSEPLKTMDEVGAALQACWTPPPAIKNSLVTLSFSFKRDGSLMGPPRATAVEVEGSDQNRKSFVDAAIDAVTQCTPLEFAPTIAEGIAGTVYTMEFTSSDR